MKIFFHFQTPFKYLRIGFRGFSSKINPYVGTKVIDGSATPKHHYLIERSGNEHYRNQNGT
jgi:hypothetical protein